MFRALLWKEWRELWVLPVAAIPLAVMSFFLTKGDAQRLTPIVWETGFYFWLIIAAVYIPTHVLAGDRETHASAFLSARPLDRFRLWWIRMLIGLAAVAVVGAVLYIVIYALGLMYDTNNPFRVFRARKVRMSVNTAFFLFSFSAFFTSLMKRRLTAVAGVVLTLLVPLSLSLINRRGYNMAPSFVYFFRQDIHISFMNTLVLCPSLLFASLALFARGSLWKQSRGRVALAYSLSAAVAVVPTLVAVIDTFPQMARIPEPETVLLQVLDMSEDYSRALLRVYPGSLLVSVDLPGRRANVIDKGANISGGLSQDGTKIIYRKYRKNRIPRGRFDRNYLLQGLFVANFDGDGRKKLYGMGLPNPWAYTPLLRESIDGKFFGLTRGSDRHAREKSFIAIADARGKILRRYDFRILEGGWLIPLGWDNESRFYFSNSVEKGRGRSTVRNSVEEGLRGSMVWTVTPDDIVPQKAAFQYPEERIFGRASISPDGRWIVYVKPTGREGRRGGWLFDISEGTSHLVSEYTERFNWSRDGQKIALVEAEGRHQGRRTSGPIPPRLVVYEPQSERRISFSVEDLPGVWVREWSPSDRHLLLSYKRHRDENGKRIMMSKRTRGPCILSLETGRFLRPTPPSKNWDSRINYRRLRWTAGDRLLWAVENRLIVTEYDGSNPQELFRVEDDRFYFDGEEQS